MALLAGVERGPGLFQRVRPRDGDLETALADERDEVAERRLQVAQLLPPWWKMVTPSGTSVNRAMVSTRPGPPASSTDTGSSSPRPGGVEGGIDAVRRDRAHPLGETGAVGHRDHAGRDPGDLGPGLAERVRAIAPDGIDAALDASGRGDELPVSVELAGGPGRVLTIARFTDVPDGVTVRRGGSMGDLQPHSATSSRSSARAVSRSPSRRRARWKRPGPRSTPASKATSPARSPLLTS